MSIYLKEALREMMSDWKQDLNPQWREIMGGVEPALDAVDDDLKIEVWEPIFPTRKCKRLLGANRRAHLLQAFDRILPASVKVVVVGQDPYPNIAQATGRAFEPGNLSSWQHEVPNSLQNIVRVAAVAQTNCESYLTKKWEDVVNDIHCRNLKQIPLKPQKLFDKWEKAGILWLNTSLTMTRYKYGGHTHQLKGHIPYWKPVIERIFHYLVERETGVVVFVLWGSPAEICFKKSKIEEKAKNKEIWFKRINVVSSNHPCLPSFLNNPNPFESINDKLKTMGARIIRW